MNIIFLTHYYYPHIGGVEKHVYEVGKSLTKKGNNITVVTEKYEKNLKERETLDGIKIIRFPYKHIKYLGLVNIWVWMIRNRRLFKDADVVHCHDVFIWYLPLFLLLNNKIVTTTIHGFEWNNPLSIISLFQKRIAIKLSSKTVGIGLFLKKYLNTKFTLISFGAAKISLYKKDKIENNIVYVGRLEKNTGIISFLNWLDKYKDFKVDFCGDGPLREECEKYGKVHGFTDPTPYYKKAEYVVPGGYLAALEALNYGCKLKLFWNNKLKEDYWKMSPFYKLTGKKLYNWAREQTWDKLANEYLDLYNSTK